MLARLLLIAPQLLLGASGLRRSGSRAEAPECAHDRAAAFASWREGQGSLWAFHITHNAGTSLRVFIERNAQLASKRVNAATDISELEVGRVYYDNLAAEWGLKAAPLSVQVPCTSNKFVSIFAVRDPIPRILSQDASWTTTGSENVDKCNTDNYGLRKLIGKPFNESLAPSDLDFAKRRLESFDFVLDVANLNSSVGALCGALGFGNCEIKLKHATTREEVLAKVGPTVYQRWMERNAPENELYRHAQELAKKHSLEHPSVPVIAHGAHSREEEDEDEDELEREQGASSWTC